MSKKPDQLPPRPEHNSHHSQYPRIENMNDAIHRLNAEINALHQKLAERNGQHRAEGLTSHVKDRSSTSTPNGRTSSRNQIEKNMIYFTKRDKWGHRVR